jgi:hypothetical protein
MIDVTSLTSLEQAIIRLSPQINPYNAHRTLFEHRHPNETPDFHFEIIRDLHGESRRILLLAFRGAAKSTLAEEAITIGACWRRFRNHIIIGESATRACERLASVKHELDFNPYIRAIFGDLHGPVWNEDKIVLNNGVVIQAFGRGQSLRGTKHDDQRPDCCLIDDIEDEESVSSPEQREKTRLWLMRTLIPALAPDAKVHILANLLDPDCLAAWLEKNGGWTVHRYPWEYIDAAGERQATWPSRFPLHHIDFRKDEFFKAGMLNEYMQEYMVEAVDPSTRVFTRSMFKIEPIVRTWHPTYAMYDPARTVKASSAHTGKVVFSWVGTKLIVWDASGELWMPDKIIEDIFQTWEEYQPIKIGIEKEGLEEFILQPLRAEQTRRQQIIPVTTLPAPVGKLAFIRSLQPFFVSGEVTFAKELPTLQQQLLSFPTGRIDVPNALAYALRMRPGLAIYDNFGFNNVQDDLDVQRNTTCYLAVNATRLYTTGVMVQQVGGMFRVVASYVREGEPGNSFQELITAAKLFSGGKVTCYAPAEHWGQYDSIGLRSVATRVGVRLNSGGSVAVGREETRRRLESLAHGQPALVVSSGASWALNAFAGGYAASIVKSGPVSGAAEEGVYKVLMEGFEAFMAVAGHSLGTGDERPNYAIDGASGRRYLTARPSMSTGHGETKIQG